MRRRDFLGVLGSTVVAWPWAGHAEQIEGVRRVAYLHVLLAKDDQRARRGFIAFKTEMMKLGWIEGKNIRFESDWGWYSSDRFPDLATEVVRQTPDVIYVVGTPLTVALHQETKRLPIDAPACRLLSPSHLATCKDSRMSGWRTPITAP